MESKFIFLAIRYTASRLLHVLTRSYMPQVSQSSVPQVCFMCFHKKALGLEQVVLPLDGPVI